MAHFICETCGVQYESSVAAPEKCTICSDERQYLKPSGQSWTTLETLIGSKQYKNEIHFEEKGLYSIKTVPGFGIGQTSYLVQGNGFNLLWDCVSYIDEAAIQEIKELGGLHAIALSHPHFYSSIVEWAEAFDVPVYIHEDDKEWVMRPSERIVFWSGELLELQGGLVLHRLGGHYKGSSVLEWKDGNNHQGILFTGDTIQVVADHEWVSFMYSYPNLIPLPASKVQEMANTAKGLKFDRLYNAFHRVIKEDANHRVQISAKRYIEALNGTLFNT